MFLPGGMTHDRAVIAHELAHGITNFAANLRYSKQPGAPKESFSDLFGALVKQHGFGQTADEADWLIGEGILAPDLGGEALRSLKAPGTAHRFDSQLDSMAGFMDLPDDDDPRANDNGGVHINCGIPHRAFYLAATAIGGKRLGEAGANLLCDAAPGRELPVPRGGRGDREVAGEMFGDGGDEQEAVRSAWGDRRCALTGGRYPRPIEVAVFRGGGLAGLVRKIAVNEESLTLEQADELRAKLDEVGVLSVPTRSESSSGQADRFSYAVQVQDEDGERRVRASEPALPDSFLELTSYLKTPRGSREEIVPVGDLPTR
jgi:hypothetical protein